MIFLGKGFVDNNFVSDISKLDPIMPIPYNFIWMQDRDSIHKLTNPWKVNIKLYKLINSIALKKK